MPRDFLLNQMLLKAVSCQPPLQNKKPRYNWSFKNLAPKVEFQESPAFLYFPVLIFRFDNGLVCFTVLYFPSKIAPF
jgi:hypothetical protein